AARVDATPVHLLAPDAPADRRVLRPSPRVALVRPQRGVRTALFLSRLEIRRDRTVRRDPIRAGSVEICREDQAPVLTAGGARRHPLDLYGAARDSAADARVGIHHRAAAAALHEQAV